MDDYQFLSLCFIWNDHAFLPFKFGGIAHFTEAQSQFIALFFSVILIITIFTFFDINGCSPGRRMAKLKLTYTKPKFQSTLVSNLIKCMS